MASFLFLLSQSPSSPFCSVADLLVTRLVCSPFSCDFCLSRPPLLWTRPVILCPLIQTSPAAPLSHSLSRSHSLLRARVRTQSFAPVFIPGLRPLCFAPVVFDCLFLIVQFFFNVIIQETTTPQTAPIPTNQIPLWQTPYARVRAPLHTYTKPGLDRIPRINSQTHTPYIELHVVRQQLIRRPLIRRPCQRSSSTELAPSSVCPTQTPSRNTLWTQLQACCLSRQDHLLQLCSF